MDVATPEPQLHTSAPKRTHLVGAQKHMAHIRFVLECFDVIQLVLEAAPAAHLGDMRRFIDEHRVGPPVAQRLHRCIFQVANEPARIPRVDVGILQLPENVSIVILPLETSRSRCARDDARERYEARINEHPRPGPLKQEPFQHLHQLFFSDAAGANHQDHDAGPRLLGAISWWTDIPQDRIAYGYHARMLDDAFPLEIGQPCSRWSRKQCGVEPFRPTIRRFIRWPPCG